MVAERLQFGPIDHARPDLIDMLERLKRNTPAFRHQEFGQPQQWYGVTKGEKLLSAYGWDSLIDGTIDVRYAVCEPSREGAKMLGAIAGLLAKSWAGYRVVFFAQVSNLRMRRIVETLGAKPIALLYEWGSGTQNQ